jgi:phage terminase large subunit
MKIDFSKLYEIMNYAFWDFFENKDRIRISYGGAGSGKSVQAFQEIIFKVLAEPGHNYLICRKVANTNKTSTYSLFLQLVSNLAINTEPDEKNIDVSSFFKINKSDMTITCKDNGNMVIFKGLDDIEKIKSITFPKGVLTDIVVEEASEITQKDFDQLNVRLRGKAKVPFQITMLLNPIINTHWIKKEFIDFKSYQKKFPVTLLKTTYLDNDFIDEDYKAVLEGYKDIDYEFYKVYCLGEWGVYGNIIFNNWSFGKPPCREEDFDAIYNGLDFGYIHPQVISKIGFKDGTMYSYDELCVFEKTNKEIIQHNKEVDTLHPGEAIRCDSEAPDKIKEWVQHGYGAMPAKKGKGSILRGIDFVKSQNWIIDDTKCPRLAQEVQIYHRKEDKDGNTLEEEVDLFNDAIKAHYYALEPLSKMKGKPNVLSGSKSDHKKSLIEAKKEERKKIREVKKAQKKKERELLKKQRKKKLT